MMPVAYIEDNRLFDANGNPYAIYIVESLSYAFQNKRTKEAAISKFISGVSGLTGEFYLYLMTRQFSIDQVMREMRRHGDHTSWLRHQQISQILLEKNMPFSRVNMIVVPLNRNLITFELSTDNWLEWTKEAGKSVLRGIQDVKERFYSKHVEIPQEVLDDIYQQSQDYLVKLRSFGKVRKATLREVEWWLKKPYHRGISDPEMIIPEPFPVQVISRGGRNVLRPVRSSIHTLSDALVHEKINRIVIKHDEEIESHQSFHVTTKVPSPISPQNPTGHEWLYGVTEALRFPVDVAVYVKVEPHNKAQENLKGKKKTAEEQKKEWTENNQDVPLELEQDLATVRQLEQKLRNRQPLLHVTTTFAIGADSHAKLKSRESAFLEQAGKYHTLIRGAGDSRLLFQSFYPFGEDLPTSWSIPMDPGVLAAAVPLGTRELGDPSGFWLGRLTNDKVVFMNPPRPAQELNTASAMMFVGKLGSGKTYTMMIITYMLITWGAVGFAIDPKGDFARFARIPSIRDDVKLVSFTYDSETPFSPFRLGNSKAQSSEAAFGVLELLFNIQNDETRNIVLGTALENMYKGQIWDMHAFKAEAEKIRDYSPEETYKEQAKTILARIEFLKDHSLGRLLFGHDTGDMLFDKNFFVAVVRGLTLPARGIPKKQWSEGERLSAAMLFAVASLGLKQLMSYPKNQVKVLALDEVWVLKQFEAGRKLYNEALRLSRSENLIPLLASQNATDFEAMEGEEEIAGLFGWKFMYKLDSLKQVEAALRILGMTDEDPEKWVKTFADKYQEGFGLVKDPEGRIGELQVELIDKELDKYFSSTPKEKEKVQVQEIEVGDRL